MDGHAQKGLQNMTVIKNVYTHYVSSDVVNVLTKWVQRSSVGDGYENKNSLCCTIRK